MRLPRDLSGSELVAALSRLGYVVTRQKGSHLRLTTQRGGEHHVTIPNHGAIRLGTLRSILDDVATHANVSIDEVNRLLFDR